MGWEERAGMDREGMWSCVAELLNWDRPTKLTAYWVRVPEAS
jgi:hypothetical protein